MESSVLSGNGGQTQKLHVLMFPYFAFGHITPFLHLSNKLAQRGHRVSFLLPKKCITRVQHQNLHPHLFTFHPLTVPAEPGLPQGAETTADVPYSSHTLIAKAFDLTRDDQVEALVSRLAPDFLFHDFSHWVPDMIASTASDLSVIKTVFYSISAAICVYRTYANIRSPGDEILDLEYGEGITLLERYKIALEGSDALCFRTCIEVEGGILEHIINICAKHVLLTGPTLPEEEEEEARLDSKWDEWLNKFSACSSKVVYCALGSQIVLDKDQFQELVFGFEATGLPFLVVLKPPMGCASIEDALPEGFKERVEGRGVVYDGWVQQTLILKHASIGCFVSHCGYGSMWEAFLSECQIVCLPFLPDQVLSAEMMAEEMKVAVVVERGDGGRVVKEKLSESIKSVMDEEGEIGLMVKRNHLKYREMLTKEGFMSGYIDKLVEDLQELKNS